MPVYARFVVLHLVDNSDLECIAPFYVVSARAGEEFFWNRERYVKMD